MAVEYNVGGLVVIFLLIIVLVMQIQLSTLSKKIEETEDSIRKKVDELLKQKNNPK
jgi:F0F1-type ATP synthase membrane subunit b/b'